jgi:pectate lyase
MKKSIATLSALLGMILLSAQAFSQAASVTWNLTAPDSQRVSSISGDIVAVDQYLSNLPVPASGGYTTNTAQRTSAKSGGVDGTWTAESAENTTRYMQFQVSPISTSDLIVSSLSFYLWANSGSNMKANVYYSTDPTFATRTQIGGTISLSSTAPTTPNVSASPAVTVSGGQSFFVRVYPWNTGSTTGKYVVTKTVVISGTTSTAGASITPSIVSLTGFSQTVGVPSSVQSYTISGNGLTASVTVTPPAGFELSTDGGSSWWTNSSPLILPVAGGNITGQPVSTSVRLNAASGGSYSGNITHASTGVTTANVALSGFALSSEPTVQSTIGFGTVTGSSIVVNLTGGNGGHRILVARAGSAATWVPTDGNAVTGVNADFSVATDQGTGNKVVYDGTGTTVTVTGLIQNTQYAFAVYEYNVGSGNSQNYNTVSPGAGIQSTLAVPTIVVSPTSLAFGGVEISTTSAEQSFTVSGTTLSPESGSLTITAPAGYQVSTTSGSGFATSVSVPYSGATLASTTIYAVFMPAALGSYPGSIACSGGSATTQNVTVTGTGIGPAQRNVLEAEIGTLISAYVSTQYSGYSGIGYVDIANKTGAALEMSFRRATAATDTVRVYYALGGSSRSYSVTLNDVVIGTPSFTTTGSWTTWSSIVIMVPMQAGLNRLRFTATTNTSDNANIDRIYIGGQDATPTFKLVLTQSGSGTVTAVPTSSDSYYDIGTTVTLTAFPAGGSMFYHWSGTTPSNANPFILAMDGNKTEVAVLPVSPGFGAFPYEAGPKGFAAVGAFTYPNGTTGGTGPGAQTVWINNSDDLGSLMLRRVDPNRTFNFPPLTVYIVGTLTTGSVVSDMCDVKDVYDISIIGVGVDATLSGFGLNVVRSKNIIIRNLKIQNSPIDGITVQADDADGTGNHLWFDHLTITNCYDGALDVTHTASYTTLSWNHFYRHDKLCLMGHSDSQTSDVTMKVTYHHNYFDSTGQRHPRVRYGKAHVYNNYYRKNILYGVSSNDGADVLVEGNYFLNVPLPMDTSRDGSIPGDVVERNNVFNNCGPYQTRGTAFEASAYYNYSLDDPNALPEMLNAYAGSGKWDFSSGGVPTPQPPGIVTLASPLNGTTGLPLTQTIRWRQNYNTDSYHVQLSADSTFGSGLLLDSTLVDTASAVSGLAYGTQYFWRVRGINGVGAGAYSQIWKFRTLAAPMPAVALLPATVAFGSHPLNTTSTDSMRVKSVGVLTLHVDSVRVHSGAFTATPTLAATIPVGDSLRVSVQFTPTTVGTQSGYLLVYSDAPTSPDSIHLTGTGVQALFSGSPNPVSFGNVSVNSTLVDSITIANPGTMALTIDSVQISAGEFSLTPTGSRVVPVGGNVKYAAAFHPTSLGLQQGYAIFFNNGSLLIDSIALNGTGVNSTVLVNVSINAGWNMISNPVLNPIPGDSVRQLFPTSINAYAFEFAPGTGYSQSYRLANGKGYWEKFSAAGTSGMTGMPLTRDTVPVVAGWNMVGSISSAVDTSAIVSVPPGIRASNWFAYAGGYSPATQIQAGSAYWVKANAAGEFILANAPGLSRSEQSATPSLETTLNSVTITDANGYSQTLYFGTDEAKAIPVEFYAMPPSPPAGAFDARFTTSDGGSMVRTIAAKAGEPCSFAIALQTEAYPVRVRWTMRNDAGNYMIGDDGSGRYLHARTMTGEGEVSIATPGATTLTIQAVGNGVVPSTYALSQNYPNPFNPSTYFTVALPVAARIDATVYNVLGQPVASIARGMMEAGYHLMTWDGHGFDGQTLGSGTYFLRIAATGSNGTQFSDVRKLLMLK